MRPIDGVLFDVDDTLVDTMGAFEQALARVARAYLPDLTLERYPELLVTWRSDVTGHYRRYTRGETSHVEQRRARANELHERFGGPRLDETGFAAWDDVFEEAFVGAWQAHDDAVSTLDVLLRSGVAVGGLTNAPVAYQTAKMRRAGLDRVPVLVGTDTLGVGKPDPRVFLEACRRLGTDPERTAYVGDELDVDASAAVAAGLMGVWVDRPGGRRVEIPDDDVAAARAAGVHVIRSLAELPALVDG